MKRNLFLFLIFFGLKQNYSQEVYTTGIDVKLVDTKKVSISWRANTNVGSFVIYRNSVPITNITLMQESKKIEIENAKSRRDKGTYVFYPYFDEVEPGRFFYLVLPKKKEIRNEDLLPLLNYTLSPVIALEEFVVIEKLFIQTNLGSIFLAWSMASNCKADNLYFKIYRTTNFITNEEQINTFYPYVTLTNAYSFEDFDIKAQLPYYYTVVVGDFRILKAGKNQNVEPIIFGSVDTNVVIEKEIREETNISYQKFIDKFKRSK